MVHAAHGVVGALGRRNFQPSAAERHPTDDRPPSAAEQAMPALGLRRQVGVLLDARCATQSGQCRFCRNLCDDNSSPGTTTL